MRKTKPQSDDFSFDVYDEVTEPIIFELKRAKQTLRARYRVGYMTEPNIRRYESGLSDEETVTMEDMHKVYSTHLALALSEIFAFSKGQRMPDETEEDRKAILAKISYQDLRSMVAQIGEALNAPLDEEGTSLSDGQAPKDESAPANPTQTDT